MDAFMRRLAASLLTALLGLTLPSAARAADWLCTLSDEGLRLVCVADQDPRDEAAAPSPTASVRGTSFPLDPRRLYTVDLWSMPTDPDWVALLARSTICYRSPGCTVTMAGPLWDALRRPSMRASAAGQGRPQRPAATVASR